MSRNPRWDRKVGVAFVAACLLGGCRTEPQTSADLLLTDARIITMGEAVPEASALAIGGEVILGVGSREELDHFVGPNTEIVGLDGRTIIPGINETHIHVSDLGFQQHYAVNLEAARTIGDVQELLRRRLSQLTSENMLGGWRYPTTDEVGPWLFGLGWAQDRLDEKRMATRQDLDEVARDVPISLERIYNGIAINTKVFELLGIDFDDPKTYPDWFATDPPDFEAGDIVFRDRETGLPNGVFVGAKAPLLVAQAIPSQSLEQKVENLVLGLEVLSSLGITAIVEAGSQLGEVTEVYRAAYEDGDLPVRVTIYDGWYRSGDPVGLSDPVQIEDRLEILGPPSSGDGMLRVRGAKASADGGIGSRSAAVSVPFLPIPQDPMGGQNFGALRDPDFDYRLAQFQALADHNWEIHTHACGDVAIRQTIDVYKILMDGILKENTDADLRWSVIHAYLPDEPGTSVIEDMADYGIIAAINPANIFYEGDSFVRNIGAERMARHTPFKTFLDAGIRMASGSDYPNNSPDPWVGIYTMLTRKHQISGEAYGLDQRISLLEALKTFTINGAYLTYDDEYRGSLEGGKLADLVIIEGDLTRATDEALLEMGSKVLVTMVGGEVRYQKPGFVFRAE